MNNNEQQTLLNLFDMDDMSEMSVLLDDDHERRYDFAHRLKKLGLVRIALLHPSHEVVHDT